MHIGMHLGEEPHVCGQPWWPCALLLPPLWPELEASGKDDLPGDAGHVPLWARWPEGRQCPRTILPPSYGCCWSSPQLQSTPWELEATGELGTACVCLSPGSWAAPQWLRDPVCPQTQCFQQLEEAACLPACPCPTPDREPPSCQRSGSGRGWGTCHGPRPAMPRTPRKAEMTHALEK